MTDFFDRVERQLMEAAGREEAGRNRAGAVRRRGRLAAWFASHSALALLGGTVIVGGAGATAAAVVTTIHGTPSHPTAGVVPRGPQEHRRRTLRYHFTMAPGLWVGRVTWCQQFTMRYRPTGPWFGGGGCADAARVGVHSFGGSSQYLGPGRGMVRTAVVDRAVAYAQLTDGAKVTPVRDPALPNGWKAIVLLPGETHDGRLHLRDAYGQPFAAIRGRADSERYAPQQAWGASDASVPSSAACSLVAPAGADARRSTWLLNPQPTSGLSGYAFLPCGQTAWRIDGQWAEATILLDAASPGRAMPAVLSAAKASPDDASVLELPAQGFPTSPPLGQPFDPAVKYHGPIPAGDIGTARREGKTWIVVRAKSRALRERVLAELEIRAPGA